MRKPDRYPFLQARRLLSSQHALRGAEGAAAASAEEVTTYQEILRNASRQSV